MSDDKPTEAHYRDHSKEATRRIAKCINACDGVDDAILDLLARKDSDGKTGLQRILDRVDMSGAYKAIDHEPG